MDACGKNIPVLHAPTLRVGATVVGGSRGACAALFMSELLLTSSPRTRGSMSLATMGTSYLLCFTQRNNWRKCECGTRDGTKELKALFAGNLHEANEPVDCCVFRWRFGCYVPQRKCSDADEAAYAHDPTDQHNPAGICNRRAVDQCTCRSLDGIAAQIMALVGSTLLCLGVSSCMAAESGGTAIGRSQRRSSSFASSLPGRFIYGPHAFCCRIDEPFS